MSDLIVVDVTVRCLAIQMGPEIILEIATWIGDTTEVAEQLVAWRMGWVGL